MSNKGNIAAIRQEEPSISETATNRKRKFGNESNKARRKKAKQAKKVAIAAESGLVQDEDDIDEEKQINRALGRMDGALLTDYLARTVKRFAPKLSQVEMEDLRVPQSAFADTGIWSGERIRENIPAFLESMTGLSSSDLSKAPEQKGSPHTIVVCAAAIRAADVTRVMRCYQSEAASVAKLFAKHIKLKDAMNFIERTRISVGVGTAQRIMDLVDEGGLSLNELRRIVVDGSWSGPKKRTLFEQSEAAVSTIRLLARDDIKSRYKKNGISIFVF